MALQSMDSRGGDMNLIPYMQEIWDEDFFLTQSRPTGSLNLGWAGDSVTEDMDMV